MKPVSISCISKKSGICINFSFALFFFISLVCFLLTGCASSSVNESVNNHAVNGDYEKALYTLEENKNSNYKSTDVVLYDLDTGLLAHYARDYKQSNEALSAAEQLIFDNYTKSVSQTAASWLANDNVIDYAGESYEDIYTNLFMSLNYLNLGDLEDAMVEIRRFDNKQKSLSTQYQAQIADAQMQTKDANASDSQYANPQIQFYNSALARYLSMILYRTQGRLDDAKIDLKKIDEAFQNQSQIYSFKMPSSINEELSVPNGKARINFFAFAGQSPIKYEEAIRTMSIDGSIYYKLALPVMQKRGTETASVVVTIEDSNGKKIAVVTLEQIESIENIAVDTFKAHQSLIYFKSLARSISKAAAGAALDIASDVAANDRNNSDSAALSLIFSVASFATKIGTEVTEQADLRTSRYFPAVASVGGVTVDPGLYRVTTQYLDAWGNPVYTEIADNVDVKSKSANIVETICLR